MTSGSICRDYPHFIAENFGSKYDSFLYYRVYDDDKTSVIQLKDVAKHFLSKRKYELLLRYAIRQSNLSDKMSKLSQKIKCL